MGIQFDTVLKSFFQIDVKIKLLKEKQMTSAQTMKRHIWCMRNDSLESSENSRAKIDVIV